METGDAQMKSIVVFTFAVIVALVLSLCFYLGAFKSVELSVTEAGPYKIVYKEHIGAYHKIVPDIEVVERWAVANGEACQTSFGEYLQNPDTTDEDRLHSNAGCLVLKDWSGKTLPEGLLFREIPRRLYVVAEFNGAPSIGPQKVYPKAYKLISSQGLKSDGAVIEMYERMPEAKLRTHYHFPVAK
jgi:AraC family transcriptional regulator